MSINVTVHGNPIKLSRGKLIMSDLENVKQKEILSRRKRRIEQVRQQSKEIASNVLGKVKEETDKQLSNLEKRQSKELKQWQARKLLALQQQYNECLHEIGSGHTQAALQPIPEDVISSRKSVHDAAAKKRAQKAVERLQKDQLEKDKLKKQPVERRKHVRNVEDIRSTMVCNIVKKNTVSPFKRNTKRKGIVEKDPDSETESDEAQSSGEKDENRNRITAKKNINPEKEVIEIYENIESTVKKRKNKDDSDVNIIEYTNSNEDICNSKDNVIITKALVHNQPSSSDKTVSDRDLNYRESRISEYILKRHSRQDDTGRSDRIHRDTFETNRSPTSKRYQVRPEINNYETNRSPPPKLHSKQQDIAYIDRNYRNNNETNRSPSPKLHSKQQGTAYIDRNYRNNNENNRSPSPKLRSKQQATGHIDRDYRNKYDVGDSEKHLCNCKHNCDEDIDERLLDNFEVYKRHLKQLEDNGYDICRAKEGVCYGRQRKDDFERTNPDRPIEKSNKCYCCNKKRGDDYLERRPLSKDMPRNERVFHKPNKDEITFKCLCKNINNSCENSPERPTTVPQPRRKFIVEKTQRKVSPNRNRIQTTTERHTLITNKRNPSPQKVQDRREVSSKPNKVQYYDYENRFHQEYTSRPDLVQPASNRREDFIDLCREEERQKRIIAEAIRKAEERGQTALQKEKVKRKYDDLMHNLPILQKEERLAMKKSVDARSVGEKSRVQQEKLDIEFKKIVSRTKQTPLITLDTINDKSKWSTELETPFEVRDFDEQEPELNIANWDIPKTREVKNDREEILQSLLKRINLQRELLLEEANKIPTNSNLNTILKNIENLRKIDSDIRKVDTSKSTDVSSSSSAAEIDEVINIKSYEARIGRSKEESAPEEKTTRGKSPISTSGSQEQKSSKNKHSKIKTKSPKPKKAITSSSHDSTKQKSKSKDDTTNITNEFSKKINAESTVIEKSLRNSTKSTSLNIHTKSSDGKKKSKTVSKQASPKKYKENVASTSKNLPAVTDKETSEKENKQQRTDESLDQGPQIITTTALIHHENVHNNSPVSRNDLQEIPERDTTPRNNLTSNSSSSFDMSCETQKRLEIVITVNEKSKQRKIILGESKTGNFKISETENICDKKKAVIKEKSPEKEEDKIIKDGVIQKKHVSKDIRDGGSKKVTTVITEIKKSSAPKSQLNNIQEQNESSGSTTYLSPPDKFNIPDKKLTSAVIETETKGKQPKMDHNLQEVIDKLLSLSRRNIDELGVSSSSDISTPGSDIINTLRNINKDNEVELILKTINDSVNLRNQERTVPSNLTTDEQDNTRISTSKEMSESDYLTKYPNVLIKYTELTAHCAKRIKNLTSMINKLRQNSFRSRNSTLYLDLPRTSSRSSDSSKSSEENVRLEGGSDKPLNIDTKFLLENLHYFKDIDLSKSLENTSNEEVQVSNGDKKEKFVPFLEGIPKYDKFFIEPVEEKQIEKNNVDSTYKGNSRQRPKPPPAILRHNINLNIAPPHELSTIVEVDTVSKLDITKTSDTNTQKDTEKAVQTNPLSDDSIPSIFNELIKKKVVESEHKNSPNSEMENSSNGGISSINSPLSDLESALIKMGLDWGVAMIHKTQDAMLLTSSSSSQDFSVRQSGIKLTEASSSSDSIKCNISLKEVLQSGMIRKINESNSSGNLESSDLFGKNSKNVNITEIVDISDTHTSSNKSKNAGRTSTPVLHSKSTVEDSKNASGLFTSSSDISSASENCKVIKCCTFRWNDRCQTHGFCQKYGPLRLVTKFDYEITYG